MQSNVSLHRAQRIFYSIILFTDKYYQIMWVLLFTIIAEQDDFHGLCWVKTTFLFD